MKGLLLSLVVILFALQLSAQAPRGINYQGVARDSEGKAIASKKITVRISVLKNTADGDTEYKETHEVTTNAFGLFTLVIGQGNANTGSFDFISWAVGSKWLQLELDPNGGNSFQLIGSQQLMSVPYALYAQYSGNGLTAGQGIAITNGAINNTGDGDNSPTNEIQNIRQVFTQSNDAGGLKLTNLGAPTTNSDAATKLYVDNLDIADGDKSSTNEIQNINQVLTQSNDAGGLKLTNLGTPTAATDAATKLYVDNLVAADGDKSSTNEIQNLSQVLTQGNNAGGTTLTNIGTPTVNTDATTKQYVDAADAALLAKISTTYAFKTDFSYTNSSGIIVNNQILPFTSETFDDFNVVGANTFTALENGTYVFIVDGTYNALSAGGQLSLVVNSVKYTIALFQPWGVSGAHFNTTMIFKLTAGQTVSLEGNNILAAAIFSGTFSGYKL
jgi:hypothetical protein